MNVIEIDNDYSTLHTADFDVIHKLWTLLRFRQRGYFWNPYYKQRKWDGYIDFFHKTKGRFLTGLLHEVQMALDHWKLPYQIKDNRKRVEFVRKDIKEDFLNEWLPKGETPVTLENFQCDLINLAVKHGRGIIKAPTGSGKTLCTVGILKSLPPGTPVLFLVNRKALIKQNVDEFKKWGVKDVGIVQGTTIKPATVTVATVQSIGHIEKLLPLFKVLIVDEIHLMMSARCIKCYKKLANCSVRIAISATPFKFSSKDKTGAEKSGDEVQKYNVKGYFGPLFKTSEALSVVSLQKTKRLSECTCEFFVINQPQIPYDIYLDAVTNGIAQSWYFHEVVKKIAISLKGRTLILVERIAHGDMLNKLIPGSLWVQGKDNDDTRNYVLDQLKKSDEIVAIATTQIFGVGVNFFAHNLINAAGGKAEHDFLQKFGRGLRSADDKEKLRYIDFVFKINPYLEDHSENRIKILEDEGHTVEIKEIT